MGIAGTHNYTRNALNPAITLSLNFINGEFDSIPKILLSTLLGSLVGLFLYLLIDFVPGEEEKE